MGTNSFGFGWLVGGAAMLGACAGTDADQAAHTEKLSAEEAARSPLLEQGKRYRFLRTIPRAPTSRLENRLELGTLPPRPYPFDNSGNPELVAAHETHRALLEPVADGEFSLIIGNGLTGEEYQVTQTLDGLRVADEFARSLGHTGDAGSWGTKSEPREEQKRTGPGLRTQTIIGGVDDRVNYAISSLYPADLWPQRALVRVVNNLGGSSGTLIGNRLVLVSAHGTINASGVIDWPDVTPRQDTSTSPPYGVVGAYTYVYPAAWVSNGCSINSGPWNCDFYDWVVLVLWPTPFGSNHPGWLGYAANSDSTVEGWFHYLRGFPSCGGSQSPPNCQWGVMYGHWGSGPVLTDAVSGWPYDGIKGRLSHKVDSSEGQSGGAVFSYAPGQNGPYVIATSIANAVVSGTGGVGPRISPSLVSYFNTLRTTYP